MSTESKTANILKKSGPLDSNSLKSELVSQGYTESYARKIIQRSHQSGKILSTTPVRFDKVFLYYLEAHKGRRYAQSIRKLLNFKPSFNRVFKTLLSNKGWITAGQIGKSSGCLPEDGNTGGRLPLKEVIDQLLSLELIHEEAGYPHLFRLGTQFGSIEVKRAAFQKKLELEYFMLEGFRDWLRNCFLIAYESNTIRPDELLGANFNQTVCDFHGPTYFGPFSNDKTLSRTSFKNSFLFGDILAYRQFNKNDAESFLERMKNIAARWKSISLCPIVLAPSYSAETWKSLRLHGVIAVTLRDVFGKNIDSLMKHFWKALSITEASSENLDEIETSLELSQNTIWANGVVGNLKGALFELIIALAYRAEGYDTVLQKMVRIPIEDLQFEIDVVAIKGEAQCKLIECKGRNKSYEENAQDIERHFVHRCRAATDDYGWNVKKKYESVSAIYITSGKLGNEAKEYVAKINKSHGVECSVLERTELLAFLAGTGQKRLVEIVDKFY